MIVIIMAGGFGKRMNSDLPKVLHQVIHPINKNVSLPMLIHVIMTATMLNPSKIFIIVGKYKNVISSCINEYIQNKTITNPDIIEYVNQEEPQGTGHAIMCSLEQISKFQNEQAIIMSGDVPLISHITLLNMLRKNQNTLLGTELDNPFGCGRILLGKYNNIVEIREEKDCNSDEKLIRLVNCGIYKIKVEHLTKFIPMITNNNNSHEYYLTDIVELLIKSDIPIELNILDKSLQYEIKNVNTQKDLEELNEFIKML